jgi:hypothetical protein
MTAGGSMAGTEFSQFKTTAQEQTSLASAGNTAFTRG